MSSKVDTTRYGSKIYGSATYTTICRWHDFRNSSGGREPTRLHVIKHVIPEIPKGQVIMKRFYCTVCKKVKRVRRFPTATHDRFNPKPEERKGICDSHNLSNLYSRYNERKVAR